MHFKTYKRSVNINKYPSLPGNFDLEFDNWLSHNYFCAYSVISFMDFKICIISNIFLSLNFILRHYL